MGFFSSIANFFGGPSPQPAPVQNQRPQTNYVPPVANNNSGWSSQGGSGGVNWFDAADDSSSNDDENRTVYDLNGNPLQLGSREVKGSGGEGVVYSLPSNPKFLIKLYKGSTLGDDDKMSEIRKRIEDMVSIQALSQEKFVAWPIMPVANDNYEIIGFVMRKCEGVSFLAFRGPSSIKKHFPGWNRLDLVNVALDYVIKLKKLVKAGVLVNDFNPSNFLVTKDKKVSFIDCDSYQIPSASGGVNVSKTYFASHVAPEILKNKSLLNKPRNIHQVEFGAALTVFQILMCGLHPYNFYDPQHKKACGTPDENLLKGFCPLGKGAGCLLPQGGWYNLWSYLTCSLKEQFINTFKKELGHSDPTKRVSLDDLEVELNKLRTVMLKDKSRLSLCPTKPKSSEYRGKNKSSNCF